ncbi:MAG: efflux RND transporter periplasmic adaptor subunit [Bacteroidales bacterium]|nr:efflux RND transporter periplasmic adaptor subunit [Bacteroidales bacterium]
MYKIILAFVFVLLVVACGNNEATNEAVELSLAGDTIVVYEESPILSHIVTQESQLQDFSAEFRTIGTVRPVSGRFAEIAPPFPGRIVKSYVQLGQKVGAGSPIFELGSSEFYEATKAYFTAQSANELAQRRYNRQKELAANGVAAQKDLEQAESEAIISSQELEQAKATLHIFNIDAASLQMGQPLKVVSPISGEVVKSNITIGSYAREDSEPLAVVADLSRVWVTALVKENYFGSIKHGDHVEVFTSTHPGKAISGAIYYIGEMLEEETRSLEVIVECSNADRELKLGMFCEVRFLSSPTKAIILPSTAIMQEQDSDYVLIEETKGKYVRREVESETASLDNVLITRGISEGENVVIQGGIYLNM